MFGVIFVAVGCLGALLTGCILSRYPKYKMLAIIISLLHFLSYLAFVGTLEFYQSRIVTGI